MKVIVNVSLILVILLVSISAYIRLLHSGIGCEQWPNCYGQIEKHLPVQAQGQPDSKQMAGVTRYTGGLSLVRSLHRMVASILGVLVIVLLVAAFRKKQGRIICMCLFLLMVFLAVLGVISGELFQPSVIMGNLAGGFCMLGLLGWLSFELTRSPSNVKMAKPLKPTWLVLALFILVLQIIVGGFTSANFAATACQTLPGCHGEWWPDHTLVNALDLGRLHQLDDAGAVIGGDEQKAIHILHRLMAIVSLLVICVVAAMSISAGSPYRHAGIAALVLVVCEFAVGILSVAGGLPISLAVLHNWLAGLLLLSLLYLLSTCFFVKQNTV